MEEGAFSEHHDDHSEMTLTLSEAEAADWEAVSGKIVLEEREAADAKAVASRGLGAVQAALRQRGVHETGGANQGVPLKRYVKYFAPQSKPAPWCAYFVSWAFATTAPGKQKVPWSNPGYVGSIKEWASANKKLVSQPREGDIFGIGNHHVGLVAGVNLAKHSIWTIEGNYGNAVAQRALSYKDPKVWFARK